MRNEQEGKWNERIATENVDLPNYYHILGIPKHASRDQIKQAYRRLALLYHPDTSSLSESTHNNEQFLQLNRAYAILSSDVKRGHYDLNKFGISQVVTTTGQNSTTPYKPMSAEDVKNMVQNNPTPVINMSASDYFAQKSVTFRKKGGGARRVPETLQERKAMRATPLPSSSAPLLWLLVPLGVVSLLATSWRMFHKDKPEKK